MAASSLAVGEADGELFDAALVPRRCMPRSRRTLPIATTRAELMARVNDSLISGSPGDQRASLAYVLLDPETGKIELALAGGAAPLRRRAGKSAGDHNRYAATGRERGALF